MIANYKKIIDKHHNKVKSYKDSNKVSNWAINEVEAILEAGYMNGYSDNNTFRPGNKITRAEAVVTLDRVLKNPSPIMPVPPTTPPVAPPIVVPPPVAPPTQSSTVYANGGSFSSNKYHKSANAHGMKGAIKMTKNQAISKGYVACGSCY